MSGSVDTEKQPLAPATPAGSPGRAHAATDCFLRHVGTIARLFGLAVLAVMWAATVTSLEGKTDAPTYVGYYLVAASILVTFFEVTWVLDKMACCVRQGCCCKCWSVILWVDGWRKFLLYTALSVPLFLQGLQGLIHVVTGFCLLVLACLYLVKSFGPRVSGRHGHEPIPDSGKQPTAPTVVRHEMSTQTDVISEEQGDAWTKGRVTQKVQTDARPVKSTTPSGTERVEAATNPFDTDDSDADGTETSAAKDTKDSKTTPSDTAANDQKSQ